MFISFGIVVVKEGDGGAREREREAKGVEREGEARKKMLHFKMTLHLSK